MPRHILAVTLAALAVLQPGPAPAQPATQPLSDRAAHRFPQPVRAGALLGRDLLQPIEAQPVLGHVAGVVRQPDGAVLIVVDTGGVLGIGGRRVAVPADATALLGRYLALMDLSPAQLRARPDFDPAGTTPVPPSETLRIGLTRPFH